MIDDLAKVMWDAYAEQAGGVTFDGKPLPTFDGIGDDRQACWKAAADAAYLYVEKFQKASIIKLEERNEELQGALVEIGNLVQSLGVN